MANTTFEEDRWVLIVEFDSIQEEIDAGVYEGGIGEAANFYSRVRQIWDAGDPDYLDQDTKMEGETVTITANLIDHFNEPLAWILAHAVPKQVTLKRNGGRG